MRALWLTALTSCLFSAQAQSANCLYLNSYHKGYEWSDRMQDSTTQALKSHCRMSYFYLDAKREYRSEKLRNKGLEAANLISLAQPDLIIAADDAASEHVVVPFLKNARIPVVFIGINWDPRPLGYPMDNATGMVERWPIDQVFTLLRTSIPGLQDIAFVSSSNTTERKDKVFYHQAASKAGIRLHHEHVTNFADWKKAIINAQGSGAILLGTNQSIKDWNEQEAIDWLKAHNRRLTISAFDFMLPYSMLSVSKKPEEFGHWAADAAQAILAGNKPWQIPIVPNRQFTLRYNVELLSSAGILLPAHIRRQAHAWEGTP